MKRIYTLNAAVPLCVLLLVLGGGMLNPTDGYAASPFAPGGKNAPLIAVWYGYEQIFGMNGVAQPWINILGNVSDPEGIQQLSFQLNGGEKQALSIGPRHAPTASQGDFNIDIPTSQLAVGHNWIDISAVNHAGIQSVATVTVKWVDENDSFEDVKIEWTAVDQIQSVAQVVDGSWTIDEKGIRTLDVGYDRLIAIGDQSWQDYEVVVPLTFHNAEPVFEAPSYGASVAVALRWQGHRIWDSSQPAYGWWPLGGSARFVWQGDGRYEVSLGGNRGWKIDAETQILEIAKETPYLVKLRVETLSPSSSLYAFKFWKSGEPEPSRWQFQGEQRGWDPMHGSLLLIAHHVDVTFGDVNVTNLQTISPWEWFEILGHT